MKTIPAIIAAIIVLFSTSSARSQVGVFSVVSTELGKISFQNGVSAGVIGFEHGRDIGAGITLETAGTNLLQTGIGFFWLKNSKTKANEFFNASLNLSAVVPVIWGFSIGAESGPAIDMTSGTLLEQSAMDLKWGHTWGGRFSIAAEVGIIHCSKWPKDLEPFAGFGLTWDFQKKKP